MTIRYVIELENETCIKMIIIKIDTQLFHHN